MRKRLLAPSVLNADLTDLRKVVELVEDVADVLHLDVMDGVFVPNLTFGPLLVKAFRRVTHLPLDVHLMISRPGSFVPRFIEAGADWISFHLEAVSGEEEARSLIHAIRKAGKRAGMVVNPETPVEGLFTFLPHLDFVLVMTVNPGFGGQAIIPEALEKVGVLKERAAFLGKHLLLEVDGGVNQDNLEEVLAAGTDVVVVGSAIYTAPDPRKVAFEIRRMLDEERTARGVAESGWPPAQP
jgi:ribulose-phosphate 3-epimerase